MARSRLQIVLSGVLLAAFFAVPGRLHAQQYVVFKVITPFMSGKVVPDSARVNDYYIKIGSKEGVQIGTVMNVYRDKEIESDTGSFKVKARLFVGRMKAFDVRDNYSVGRVTDLASYSDPHRDHNAVMVGDYVQPVFVVESENLFDPGSSALRPEAIRELERAVAFVKRFKPTKVRIEGYTDNVGDAAYNLQLSQDRANSVRDYMVKQGGFSPDMFITIGYGEAKPIASNDTPEGRRKNRRFEIVVER